MSACIVNGDCLQIMQLMTDKSIDLVVTSPPYNMNLRVRNGKHCSRQIVKELSTKYSNYSDNMPMVEYLDFNVRVVRELLRVSKLVFYNVQFLTGNKSALYKLMGLFSENIKEFIVWDKVNAEPAIGSNVLNSRFETILVLSDEDDAISRAFKTAQFERGTLENVWQIKRGKKICDFHGAVFPIELAERIITNFSCEGSTVFDPFCGTGTTGKASIQNNRNFIGCDIDADVCDFARSRVMGH